MVGSKIVLHVIKIKWLKIYQEYKKMNFKIFLSVDDGSKWQTVWLIAK